MAYLKRALQRCDWLVDHLVAAAIVFGSLLLAAIFAWILR
jgi:hypothetical protein